MAIAKTMYKKVCVCFVVFILLSAICTQTYRLAKYRRLYNDVRVELEAARSRELDLAASIRRTNDLLSSADFSLSGLKRQLSIVRENYEEMERILYSGIGSFDRDNGILFLSDEIDEVEGD